jgi:FtsH-binding integral membrane protein
VSTAAQPPDNTEDTTRFDRPNLDRTDDSPSNRQEVVARQRERYGGMKFGACFFGWLTATGMAVLLTALLAAAGAGLGLANEVDPNDPAAAPVRTIGLVGGLVLLVIVLVSYFAGGYVAGRMARFDGVRQGVGVWLWALIMAVVIAALGLVAGERFNLLANINGFPRIPVNEGELTTAGVVTAVAVALLSLIGAILGGLAGMSYHRRVDREGLGR